MTYAMTLDNSWELMSEDEMYDVNGGQLSIYCTKWKFGVIPQNLYITFTTSDAYWILSLGVGAIAALVALFQGVPFLGQIASYKLVASGGIFLAFVAGVAAVSTDDTEQHVFKLW